MDFESELNEEMVGARANRLDTISQFEEYGMWRLTRGCIRSGVPGCFVLFLLCILPGATVHAQKSKLPEGGIALIFQVNQIGSLGNFDGYGLAVKKHTSTDRAWRLGLSFDIEDMDSDQKSEREHSAYSEVTSHYTWSRVIINTDLQRIWYMKEKSDLLPFIGIGPTISWYNHDRWSSSPTPEGIKSIREESTCRFAAGLGASLGAEWFFSDHMSLHAEVNLEAKYQWESEEETRSVTGDPDNADVVNRVEKDEEVFRASTESARLGLSLYF